MRLSDHTSFFNNLLIKLSPIICVVILAASIRLYKLGEWSLWIDEAFTIHDSLNFELSFRPLNYLLVRASLLNLGVSEWSARIVPAIAGVLSIAVGYGVFQRIFCKRTALLGSIFLALSTWHIYWSQNSRHYSILLLLCLVSIWFFWELFEKNRKRYLPLFLLAFALALLTHPSIVFIYPGFLIYLFFVKAFDFKQADVYNWKIILVFIAIAFLGIGMAFPKYAAIFQAFKGITDAGDPFHAIATTVFYVGPVFLVLSLSVSILLIWEKDRRGVFLLSMTGVPLLILLCLSFFVRVGSLYIFYTLPLYLYGSAHGLVRLKDSLKGRSVLLYFGFVVAIISLQVGDYFLYLTSSHGDRPRWKEAAIFARKSFGEGAVFASTAAPVIQFYFDNLNGKQITSLRNPKDVIWLENSLDKVSKHSRIICFIINDDMLSGSVEREEILSWIKGKASLHKEFKAWTGPKDRTVKIYIYNPKSKIIQIECSFGFYNKMNR